MKKVTVVGVGRLGICFALTLERAGYDVLGVDISPDYVKQINTKELKSDEQDVEEYLQASNNFRATVDFQEGLEHSDVLYVVVATPSLPDGRYDHRQLDAVVSQLVALKQATTVEKHFVICSTTMPGYCDTVQEKLSELGYVVSYNPEFIAQGTILRDQANPDMVLIGEGSTPAGDILQEMYENMTVSTPAIHRMSRTEAEITKISLNCFLTTKIAYANMVGDIVTKAGGSPDMVLSAIGAESRVGSKYLRYGFGYGGPCFPRDNRALALYAADLGIDALISKASDESNREHLKFQVEECTAASLEMPFVTYKPESTILTESQQLAYAVGLAQRGVKVHIKERATVIERVREVYGSLFTYEERK